MFCVLLRCVVLLAPRFLVARYDEHSSCVRFSWDSTVGVKLSPTGDDLVSLFATCPPLINDCHTYRYRCLSGYAMCGFAPANLRVYHTEPNVSDGW